MKNKKIIFLLVTVCCLVVCLFCFGAWTINDTDFLPSDFLASDSMCYLYIVPSSNISSSEISNVGINAIYTSTGNSNIIYFSKNLTYFNNSGNSGRYFTGWSNFSASSTVQLSVSVSAIDRTVGEYFITSVYYFGNAETLYSDTLSRSNFHRRTFHSTNYRTLILFIDKVSSGGGVSQEEYDDVVDQLEQEQLRNDQLSNDNLTLQDDLNDMTNDRNSWYNYAQALEDDYDELHTENWRLNNQLHQLDLQYTNLLNDYDALYAQVGGLDFISLAFEKVGNILQIEILPNITIGTIVAIPLILGVVFLVLRLVRGE